MEIIQNITLIVSNLATPILLAVISYLYIKKENQRDKRIEKIENEVSNHVRTDIKELRKELHREIQDVRKEIQDVRKEMQVGFAEQRQNNKDNNKRLDELYQILIDLLKKDK